MEAAMGPYVEMDYSFGLENCDRTAKATEFVRFARLRLFWRRFLSLTLVLA
jgi:hypothetical protein